MTTDEAGVRISSKDAVLVANPALAYETPPTSPQKAPEAPKKAKVVQTPSKPVGSTLARIAACESNGNLYAKNPRSTAKGKYQFLDGSWRYYGTKLWGSTAGKSVWSEKDQDELAQYVVSINGYRDWNASKHCWAR